MGSGLSLSYEQIAIIVKRELEIKFENEKKTRPKCYELYIVYRDYLEESKLLSQLREIDRQTKRIQNSFQKSTQNS